MRTSLCERRIAPPCSDEGGERKRVENIELTEQFEHVRTLGREA
jgi:hypothetical protein